MRLPIGTPVPTETWLTLCCKLKVHVRSAIESLCGTGWKYKIRPELAWFRSFRKHRSFSPDVFAVKKRAAVVLHFFVQMANANCEHSTMWAWYRFCKNFYHSSPPEQRRWALFCHLCLRQRRYKVTPYWTLFWLYNTLAPQEVLELCQPGCGLTIKIGVR